MVANRVDVGGLSLGARHDRPAGTLDFDRRAIQGRFLTGGHGEQLRHVVSLDGAPFAGDLVELLEDLGGLGHCRLFPFDMNRVIPGRDADPKRGPDAAKVLIPRTEDGHESFRIDFRDGGAGHRSQRRSLGPSVSRGK
jgi:hypothetical protein